MYLFLCIRICDPTAVWRTTVRNERIKNWNKIT